MVAAFELPAQARKAVGEIFVLGDEEAVTIKNLVNQIAEIVDVHPPRLSFPVLFMKPIAALCETVFIRMGKEPPISRRTLKFFTNNSSFNVAKAINILGFTAKYSLSMGLRRTYAYLENARTFASQ